MRSALHSPSAKRHGFRTLPVRKPKRPKAVWTRAFPEQMRKPSGNKQGRARSKALNGKAKAGHSSKHPSARSRELARYRKRVKVWIKEQAKIAPGCVVAATVFGHCSPVTECHHQRGRIGQLLLDERFWMPISRKGHRYLHDHVGYAKSRGWIAGPGDWGKQP